MQDDTATARDLLRRLWLAAGAMVAVLCFGVIGYSVLRPDTSFIDRLYMTVVTVTTVGYGEVIEAGDDARLKAFNIGLMLGGMGLLLFSVTTLTATLVEFDLSDLFRRRRMEKHIAALENHFIVCGGGETGVHIVEELVATHMPFVVIEEDSARCVALKDLADNMLILTGDATDEEHLHTAGIGRARGLCAALPNDRDNLFLTLTARGLNERLRIVARGVSASIGAKLRKAGADAVVSPTTIGGLRMASELLRPHTVSFLDQMLRRQSTDMHRFGELPVPAGSAWVGKQIQELPLRAQHLLVVAVRSPDGVFRYVPAADTVLPAGSTLIVLGKTDTVAAVRRQIENAGG